MWERVQELFDAPTVAMLIFFVILAGFLIYFLLYTHTTLYDMVKYVGDLFKYLINNTGSESNQIFNTTSLADQTYSVSIFFSHLLTYKLFIIVMLGVGILVGILLKLKPIGGGGGGY